MSHSRAIPAYSQAADIPAYTTGASPDSQERPTGRNLHEASLFPGSGTAPDPLTPLIPLPPLRAPLPSLMPLGSGFQYQLHINCIRAVEEHEKWQKGGYRVCVTPQCSSD